MTYLKRSLSLKESAGHLDMMDGLIVQLLNEKWRTFIKFK
jgi:hypothetical protein